MKDIWNKFGFMKVRKFKRYWEKYESSKIFLYLNIYLWISYRLGMSLLKY